jgi:hypothetical protein
VEIRE